MLRRFVAGQDPLCPVGKAQPQDVRQSDLAVQRLRVVIGIGVFNGQDIIVLEIAEVFRQALDNLKALGRGRGGLAFPDGDAIQPNIGPAVDREVKGGGFQVRGGALGKSR